MIGMIIGWTMFLAERNHRVHLIREIKAPHVRGGVVPDDTLLPKLMRGEVKEAEKLIEYM